MGRRPNALIVEFFQRGAKLEDSSNRYQHTCKRCGELFPKGRIDTLTSHLLRKCASVTTEDRRWIFNQIQQTPDSNKAAQSKFGEAPEIHSIGAEHAQATASPLPSLLLQQQSALDTLAEVSRRHLDFSTTHGANERISSSVVSNDSVQTPAERELFARLQQHNHMGYAGTHASSDPLVEAATAANQHLEQAQVSDQSWLARRVSIDPQLKRTFDQTQQHDTDINDGTHAMAVEIGSDEVVAEGRMPPGDISVMFTPSLLPPGSMKFEKQARNKVRGRFNDTRRKEVSETRKRGACIRCRMLKKSCSEGTPCSTCRNVDTARLWRSTCSRARLADELTLWTAGVFIKETKTAVLAALHGSADSSWEELFEIQFSHFPASPFRCHGKTSGVHRANPNGVLESVVAVESEMGSSSVLIATDLLPQQLGEYLSTLAQSYIDIEPSRFVQATLLRACLSIQAQDPALRSEFEHSQVQSRSVRSCYNLQDTVVKNVIELWTLTRFLTTPEPLGIDVHRLSTTASEAPDKAVKDMVDGHSTMKRLPLTADVKLAIVSQLLAAAETRCSQLSKIVVNELERRFLQRQQTSRFETFLSSVVLLICAERMSALFRSSPPLEDSAGNQSSFIPAAEVEVSEPMLAVTSAHRTREVDKTHSALYGQADRFASLLAMLLHIRALSPRTVQSLDGKLLVRQDLQFPLQGHDTPLQNQIDEQNAAAAAWLDPIELDFVELVTKRDGPVPDRMAPLDQWTMRYVSRALLPEGPF